MAGISLYAPNYIQKLYSTALQKEVWIYLKSVVYH